MKNLRILTWTKTATHWTTWTMPIYNGGWKTGIRTTTMNKDDLAAKLTKATLDDMSRPMSNKDDVAGLVEELRALHVWPQFVADSHADILLPRQSKGLYGVGETAHRAADALTTLSARVETLEAALRFYADEENPRAWAQQTVTDAQNPCGRRNVGEPTPTPALLFDQGSIARQALAGE